MPLCSQCGTDNPVEARFCLACGSPLRAGSAVPRELRKTVTIVFSDLTGSTRLGERLDSEALRQVMSRYYETMRVAIERHGGTVEKFIGDAVMAVFGIPTLHEDDALRAVRAANEMRESLETLNARLEARWGVRLQTRTGVNTGEVVAGDHSQRQSFATGDAVNVAARLEQAAGPGEILIGDGTHRLVRDAVRVEPVQPLSLKGKSRPVPAFRLVDVVGAGSEVTRRLDSPIVGRERELALLRSAFEAAVAQRTCRLATVVGPAGVGKSRLVRELLAALEDRASILRSRSLPYGEGITFWPVAEIVRRSAGVSVSDPPDAARAKIKALLPADDDAEAVVDHLAGAIGLSDATPSPQETSWAVRMLLAALGRERPLVVVFDDVHWADDTFLDLLEYLAGGAHELPVLLVALARPELLEARPSLATGTEGATVVTLSPLSRTDSRRLIDNLLGHAPLPEELSERIATAAGGNPLFVEEMLRMLADEGILRRDEAGWTQVGELSAVSVPPTIQALLAARLDRLRPAERAAIERASVIGQVFTAGAVRALSPEGEADGLDAVLEALARKELVGPGGARFAGEDALCFGHILIRDVAYHGMLKQARADLHERFAGWLERTAGERLTEYEEIVGYHVEQAHRFLTQLGAEDERTRRLAAAAVDRLGRSGARALARGEMPAAVKLLDRAMALVADDDPLRAGLALKLGIALAETGDLARADSLLSDRLDFERRGRSFLSYSDATGKQRVFDLDAAGARITIGRRAANDIALSWDGEVSRHHAALERTEEGWALVDEGMSRNGSYINGRRVAGRNVLSDGDVLRFGDTIVLYRVPGRAPSVESQPESNVTAMAPVPARAIELSETERRVLAALSRQLADPSASVAAGTHRRIADELSMMADEVEEAVSRLSRKFHTEHLPEGERHDRLVERASEGGLLERPDARRESRR
jgi:class 3 adenylate cyclase/type II secretory pathway predicted ATPase ExeA